MNREKVRSREYKIMLEADRFKGAELDLIETAERFWTEFRREIDDLVLATSGNLSDVRKRRSVSFYDTRARRLRSNDYVLRERSDLETGKREVTLKFRHPDRYVTQDRNMDAAEVDQGETKSISICFCG